MSGVTKYAFGVIVSLLVGRNNDQLREVYPLYQEVMGKTITNNIPENAADIISPNLQESMRSNNQRAAIINHQKHK